jgi:hypothetical protein
LVADAAGSADAAGAGAAAGAGVGAGAADAVAEGGTADAVADGGGLRTAAVAGFFFAAGLRADGAAPGCNSTKTGFGASFEVPSASRTDTVCG